jgi:RimJ/RimL family protein N-acetyltransferase
MKLVPISEHPDHAKVLYELLAERDHVANISHKAMPTWEQHQAFIASDPYAVWSLIDVGGQIVGSIYLTDRDEIGVAVFWKHQRRGYGANAVQTLMALLDPKCQRRFLANVAPGNEASRKMFEKLGFKLVQHTYCMEAE